MCVCSQPEHTIQGNINRSRTGIEDEVEELVQGITAELNLLTSSGLERYMSKQDDNSKDLRKRRYAYSLSSFPPSKKKKR
jgi:hypothetical protein